MIIGLSGYARSGKDTVADVLVRTMGFTRIAFADKLRELLYATNPQIDGIPLQTIVDEYGWNVAKARPEVRRLLQDMGVGARTALGEDVWVKAALEVVRKNPTGKYVVSDVRFPNEAHFILYVLPGQLWRITRPGVQAVNSHSTENSLDDWKFITTIHNNSTIESLDQVVRELIGFKN